MLRALVFTHSPRLLNKFVIVHARSFKSELKIKWVRPEKIPCTEPAKTGDLKSLPDINIKSLPPCFEKSEELKTASNLVKRLFTLEFQKRNVKMKVIHDNMVNSVKRHKQDVGSVESEIASMTAVIRNLQDVFASNPYNKKLKVTLKELIDKRKKWLKRLRKRDYKRFEWLLEKLDLQYRPPPSHFHWITRKESLRKLTDKYCEDLKQERLDVYKNKLESQKIEFLTDKFNKLQWIMKEEKECGIEPTVLQSDIVTVQKQLEELKIKKESENKEESKL